MDELKTKLLEIIGNLPDSEDKNRLVAQVNNSEITAELVNEISEHIALTVFSYENDVVGALTEAEKQIDGILTDFRKEADAENLGQIRSGINQ